MNRSIGVLTLLLVSGAAISGCSNSARTGTSYNDITDTVPSGAIVLDGIIDEWPSDAACVADGTFVYTRFIVDEEMFTLQAAPRPVAMLLDTDANVSTGMPGTDEASTGLGVDLEIVFSPPAESGGGATRSGVAAFTVANDGTRTPAKLADIGIVFAPTYASNWYECRVTRSGIRDMDRAGAVRGVVVTRDAATGSTEKWSDQFGASLPPMEPLPLVEFPTREEGTIRVMSFNVLKSSPAKRPDAFARLFNAAAPDVVLIQEWDQGSATDLIAWFSTFVESGGGWHAAKSDEGGVAILSRYPLEKIELDWTSVSDILGEERVPRFIGASIGFPDANVFVGSTHLKCCGSSGSSEDTRREIEAASINAIVDSLSADIPEIRIIGGDMNLVGSRPPIDTLRASIDADGSDLAIVDAAHPGERAFYTWRDGSTQFTPGRLDYLLVSDAVARIVNSFVLDTTRYTDASLEANGLQRDDSSASDHLPVIADIRPGIGGVTEPVSSGFRAVRRSCRQHDSLSVGARIHE